MRRWRSCSPRPRPTSSNSQCELVCSPGCCKPCCIPRGRCRSVSPVRGVRPFYVQRQNPLWDSYECNDPCYRIKRDSCCVRPSSPLSPPCEPCDWRFCDGSPTCYCWKCAACPPQRYRIYAEDKMGMKDTRCPVRWCQYEPKSCDPCLPRRYYKRRCDPCDPCYSRRCDPCDSCYPRRYNPSLPRKCSPCEPSCDPCPGPSSPLRCRLRRSSPCDPCRALPCDPCQPCRSPSCRYCRLRCCRSSSTDCPVEERFIESGKLFRDRFTKVCYPRAVPCKVFDRRSTICDRCQKDPCLCKSHHEENHASSLPMATIGSPCSAAGEGPSTSFLEKSRKLGKNMDRYTPHYCPWEANVAISGTIRGHCTSTAVEVARRMTGRFKASGDRYTLDSCPKPDRFSTEPQRMNLGILDDGTALNLSRNNPYRQGMYSSQHSLERGRASKKDSQSGADHSSLRDGNISCRKSTKHASDCRCSVRDYNISCCSELGSYRPERSLNERASLNHSNERRDKACNSFGRVDDNGGAQTSSHPWRNADFDNDISANNGRPNLNGVSHWHRCDTERVKGTSDHHCLQLMCHKQPTSAQIGTPVNNVSCSSKEKADDSPRNYGEQKDAIVSTNNSLHFNQTHGCSHETAAMGGVDNNSRNEHRSSNLSGSCSGPLPHLSKSPHTESLRLCLCPESGTLKVHSSRRQGTGISSPPCMSVGSRICSHTDPHNYDSVKLSPGSNSVSKQSIARRPSYRTTGDSDYCGANSSERRATRQDSNSTRERADARATSSRAVIPRRSDTDSRKSCLSTHVKEKKTKSRKKRVTYSGD